MQHLGWLGCKILEVFFSTFCISYNFKGYMYINKNDDFFLYIIIFVGFDMITMLSIINICLDKPSGLATDCFINFCASILFIGASIYTMYEAETDFYLLYTAATEDIDLDPAVPFFYYSKAQSICALITGTIHMLHFFLLFDVITSQLRAFYNFHPDVSGQPLQVYCMGRYIHEWIDDLNTYSEAHGKKESAGQWGKLKRRDVKLVDMDDFED